jgi:hypothetical protein
MDSNFESVRALTADSLVTLRAQVAGNKILGRMNLEKITAKLSSISDAKLDYFDHKTILIDTNFRLKSGGGSSLKDDLENAKSFRGAFQGMTPALATDERLWVTLALTQFYEYSTNRWGLSSSASPEESYKYFKNHVLAATPRDRWRNQSLARLWWVGNFASNLGADLQDKALEVFYFNSDLGQQLLGRPNISQPMRLTRSIIRVAHQELVAGNPSAWDRKSFRQFMIDIDFLIGRRKIESIAEDVVVEEIRDLFRARFV